MVFISAGNGFAVGYDWIYYGWGTPFTWGIVCHTLSGGNYWSIQNTGMSSSCAISFIDSLHGGAVGRNKIMHTSDGGGSWTTDTSGLNLDLLSIDFPDLNHGWAVGYGGAILRYHNTTMGTRWAATRYLPDVYILKQNYPNPFNSTTTIEYNLPKLSHVDLVLFDITGREVKSLIRQSQHPGIYRISFDAKSLASGEYFYRLSSGNFQAAKKLTFIK